MTDEPRKPEFWPDKELSIREITEKAIEHLRRHKSTEAYNLSGAELDLLMLHVVCLEESNEVHKMKRRDLEAKLAASEKQLEAARKFIEKVYEAASWPDYGDRLVGLAGAIASYDAATKKES